MPTASPSTFAVTTTTPLITQWDGDLFDLDAPHAELAPLFGALRSGPYRQKPYRTSASVGAPSASDILYAFFDRLPDSWVANDDFRAMSRAERTVLLAATCDAKVCNDGFGAWHEVGGDTRIGATARALLRVGAERAAHLVALSKRVRDAEAKLAASASDEEDHTPKSWARRVALQRRTTDLEKRLIVRYGDEREDVDLLVVRYAFEAYSRDRLAFARPPQRDL